MGGDKTRKLVVLKPDPGFGSIILDFSFHTLCWLKALYLYWILYSLNPDISIWRICRGQRGKTSSLPLTHLWGAGGSGSVAPGDKTPDVKRRTVKGADR